MLYYLEVERNESLETQSLCIDDLDESFYVNFLVIDLV
jgi:hypothetical protein